MGLKRCTCVQPMQQEALVLRGCSPTTLSRHCITANNFVASRLRPSLASFTAEGGPGLGTDMLHGVRAPAGVS